MINMISVTNNALVGMSFKVVSFVSKVELPDISEEKSRRQK